MKSCAGVQVSEGGGALTRRRFLLGAAALAASASIAPARATTLVDVERQGDEVHVEAHAEVDAALAQTWSTLADYDRLAEFIPDMLSSRTLTRTGATAVIEQKAQATFGPFHRRFRLVLAVEEAAGESIRAVAVDGDFRRFDARYDLVAIDVRRTRIDYRAALQPSAGVPPLIGVAVMRSLIRRQFEAMLGEIGRRAAVT
ncbi:MAG TPA: SRPBCC family protein [Burkholderiaceae bacterium]|nr:SRPBCC family protein [Burkholderiaceae bacterium]